MRGKVVNHKTRRVILITCVAALASILAALGGCQGLPPNVADCPVTPTAPANTSIVPPAAEPPPAALCGFPIQVAAPASSGSSVNSPVHLIATAQPPDPIYTVRVYVDGLAVLYTPDAKIDQHLWMTNGQHTIEIVAEDTAGYIATSTTKVNVVAQDSGLPNIQNIPQWVTCSAVISGNTCAAGLGVAESSLELHQSAPSLDGSAAKFSIAGKTPYSNELYWIPLGGGSSPTHFIYDLWFYVDNGDAPQSLEFDVNQTFGGTRWTWGTQCDFNQSHLWNIWDPLNGVWRLTDIPCVHFPSNTWIHLVWTLERVGNQVHYISVNVANQNYNVDTYYTAQPNWYQEEIDIAFQMDGNYEQQPYDVWLDEVTLSAY